MRYFARPVLPLQLPEMEPELFNVLLGGAIRDPLLWIIGTVFGWDQKRPARLTLAYLITAGSLWGTIRVAVYIGFGETLGLQMATFVVAICVVLMLVFGFIVREARWYFAKPR